MSKKQSFSTIAIHAGQEPAPGNRAIMTPVYQTSTYVQTSPGVVEDYDYARTANPTRTALENNLAALEGGSTAICFSSGVAAMAAVMHLFGQGTHVISGDDVYGGTFRLFDKVFRNHGHQFSFLDLRSVELLSESITPATKMIWLETPTNPLLRLIDLEAVISIAHKKGVLVAVDNTFASPYLQNPLFLGADLVVHSSTKYIGGHSDVIGGVVITNDADLGSRLRFLQNAVGAVPGPWDCFLLLRSTKTLAVRMDRHCDNAERISEFLLSRSDIEWVSYPGHPSHDQFSLCQKQMKRGGGMISMKIKGDLDRARSFLERTKLFALAESLGGVESLIEHPAIMTHASIPRSIRANLGITDNLIRLSVGIEDSNDLIDDLAQALDGARPSF